MEHVVTPSTVNRRDILKLGATAVTTADRVAQDRRLGEDRRGAESARGRDGMTHPLFLRPESYLQRAV